MAERGRQAKIGVLLFPYIDTSHWNVGDFAFNPFPALVAIGLAVGYLIARHRAARSGIGRENFTKLGLVVIGAAFIGGHLAKFTYLPGGWSQLTTHPEILLTVLSGQASFGCFIGGYLAALGYLVWNRVAYRDWYLYADAACFAVPFGWWLGRVGCYLAHDHPGLRTTSFLGVQYPGGTRYDLGLLEALFLLALAAVFLWLDRKPRPRGFFYVAFLFSYGSFRFLLDQLHVDPPRFAGFSVDEIAASLMIFAGVLTTFELLRLGRVQHYSMPPMRCNDSQIGAVPQEE